MRKQDSKNSISTAKLPKPPVRKASETPNAVECPCCPHGGITFEEAIRVRAYQLWERAGRPQGDGISFWMEAEAELKGSK